MNKAVLLILTGTLAGLASGCSLLSNPANSSNNPEENVVKPILAQADTSPQNEQAEVELVDLESEAEPLTEIAGLIPATDPDVRVRNSVRGRKDPFAVVTLNPKIEIEPEKSDPHNISNPFSGRENLSSNDEELELSEPVIDPTLLAQDVVISGLYEANGRIRLIVQAPEEDSSRYVEVGEYLSNGQVLVKRIEEDNLASPIIILEQSGVEIAKTIGESIDNDADDVSFLPSTIHTSSLSSSISLN